MQKDHKKGEVMSNLEHNELKTLYHFTSMMTKDIQRISDAFTTKLKELNLASIEIKDQILLHKHGADLATHAIFFSSYLRDKMCQTLNKE